MADNVKTLLNDVFSPIRWTILSPGLVEVFSTREDTKPTWIVTHEDWVPTPLCRHFPNPIQPFSFSGFSALKLRMLAGRVNNHEPSYPPRCVLLLRYYCFQTACLHRLKERTDAGWEIAHFNGYVTLQPSYQILWPTGYQ